MINGRELIRYPELDHPLAKESKELKVQYLDLMGYFSDKYIESRVIADKKIESLAYVMLNQAEDKDSANFKPKGISIDELKIRFPFFRFSSYRQLFLFDCLLLIAADNAKMAEQIKKELNPWPNKSCHEKIDRMVRLMYQRDGRFAKDTLITEEMAKAWMNIEKYVSSEPCRIFFTATMSAGKSTLINAIIGQAISDTKKAACTSHVLCFHSLPARGHVYTLYDGESAVEGTPDEIRDRMRKANRNCEVYGYFYSALSQRRICLIDTPGINSSRNPEHKMITRATLEECKNDLLIYVIPVENYGGEDDYNHLVYILNHIKYKKIIFLVNMIDTCDFEDDSLEQILTDIKEHLCSIGYEAPEVYPISAKAGLEIKRRVYKENISEHARNRADTFIKMFVKDEYDLSKYYGEEFSAGRIEDDIWRAYVGTGLPAFEQLLNTYH